MKYVEIVAGEGSLDTVKAIAEQAGATDMRATTAGDDGMQLMRMLVSDDRVQKALDALQNTLGAQEQARITVLPVEIALPKPPEAEVKEEDKATAVREALHEQAEKGARLNLNYLVLTVLSTVVAAIGMLENSVAVIIGAMVIAPLLGPNLAFALGTALADVKLMREAALSLGVGLALAVLVSVPIGMYWQFGTGGPELISRTEVGLDSVALALASGAAAALSMTTGLSSVLVGVMVAVALLPPAAALGIMLGHGDTGLAIGSALLLAINVVCVNLASKTVFLVKRIRPRAWREKERAKHGMAVYIVIWVVTLAVLVGAIYARRMVSA